MQRRTVAIGLAALPLALWGCASQKSMADPLIGGLTKSLGVTENQAMGGVGSVLTLAQENLAAGQFNQIASVIRCQQVSRYGKESRRRDGTDRQ